MRLVLTACLLLGMAQKASAATSGADYVIHVLTFGPGDHPFFKFGHNAIWVHDKVEKTDRVYNWGTFYFDSPMLIPQFMKGLLRYWLSVDPLGATIAAYRYENRTVDAQELMLSDAEKLELVRAIDENARPENMYYRYDYYMDNCSTRVRDAVDRVTGGALHKAVDGTPATYTFREHTRRLTQDDLWEYLALDIVMADFIDKPIDFWAEMFLPIKVFEGLQKATVHRDTGDAPLVSPPKSFVRAPGRLPPPTAPPRWHLWFLAWGALLGIVAAVAGFKHRASKIARFVLGLGLASAGIFGLLGCIFVVFWVATDHRVAWHNENIMQCAPWAIAAFAMMGGVRKRVPKKIERAFQMAAGAAALSVIGLLAKALPMADQVNGEWICFFMPFWFGLTAALFLVRADISAKAKA
jgi:hypothetical protein